MLCWSCGKEIAENATRCQHCEADTVSPPDTEEMELAREFLDNMDPEIGAELLRVFQESENGEEFINRIMIGDCPLCDSSKTSDCEHDPDVEDLTMGRCFDCGHVWCTVCDSSYTPGQKACKVCDELEEGFEDPLSEDSPPLERYHLLAAEIFGYSFANYRDHLGIGNVRYEQIMPDAARALECAVQDNWPATRLANELFPGEQLTEEEAQGFLNACKDALHVLSAENPAESFRNAVRLSVQRAVDDGLDDKDAVEELVKQICYRTSDLAVLLDLEGQNLERYSRHLRREPDVEYYDGYFDE